ncbi:MAG: MTAP family purine nucleoside phosphorylase [Clostridiales bacterium]|nr:MTAP family purine nucleoside phosphorylase [Clostridiales bacterium]
MTPYGDATLCRVTLRNGDECVFIPRHGFADTVDAREVNYRANIYALSQYEVTHVVSLSAVGTCDYAHKPGSYCLITDFIDFTKTRENSFNPEHRNKKHVGMEDVFDSALTETLERELLAAGLPYSGRVIYAGTDGPRFETASEVRMMRMVGAQVIGMALVPEASLAAERALRYASIGIIANYATGMSRPVRDTEIDEVGESKKTIAIHMLLDYIERSAV